MKVKKCFHCSNPIEGKALRVYHGLSMGKVIKVNLHPACFDDYATKKQARILEVSRNKIGILGQ